MVQGAVFRAPGLFLRSWLQNEGLRPGLALTEKTPVHEVVRWFLWNYVEQNPDRTLTLAQFFQGAIPATEGENVVLQLRRISEVCPPLVYSIARNMVRGKKYSTYARCAAAELLHRPHTSSPTELKQALSSLATECAGFARLRTTVLQGHISAMIGALEKKTRLDPVMDAQLRRIGELDIGRRFLGASLLLRVIERTGGL